MDLGITIVGRPRMLFLDGATTHWAPEPARGYPSSSSEPGREQDHIYCSAHHSLDGAQRLASSVRSWPRRARAWPHHYRRASRPSSRTQSSGTRCPVAHRAEHQAQQSRSTEKNSHYLRPT